MLRTPMTVCLSLGFTLLALATAAVIGALPSAAAEEKSAGQLRHVVLFKFKDTVSKDQVAEVVAAFGALPGKIPTIRGFEWGTDVSVEMKAEGFTHCFVVTFADAKGRDEYLPHAAHKDFIKIAGPRIEKVLVFDYVVGK